MLKGGYSDKHKRLQRRNSDPVVKAGQAFLQERELKVRELSKETNRRRRDLAEKKKQLDIKEEKRRQRVLSARREQQRDATERFQKFNTPTIKGKTIQVEEDFKDANRTLKDGIYVIGEHTVEIRNGKRIYHPIHHQQKMCQGYLQNQGIEGKNSKLDIRPHLQKYVSRGDKNCDKKQDGSDYIVPGNNLQDKAGLVYVSAPQSPPAWQNGQTYLEQHLGNLLHEKKGGHDCSFQGPTSTQRDKEVPQIGTYTDKNAHFDTPQSTGNQIPTKNIMECPIDYTPASYVLHTNDKSKQISFYRSFSADSVSYADSLEEKRVSEIRTQQQPLKSNLKQNSVNKTSVIHGKKMQRKVTFSDSIEFDDGFGRPLEQGPKTSAIDGTAQRQLLPQGKNTPHVALDPNATSVNTNTVTTETLVNSSAFGHHFNCKDFPSGHDGQLCYPDTIDLPLSYQKNIAVICPIQMPGGNTCLENDQTVNSFNPDDPIKEKSQDLNNLHLMDCSLADSLEVNSEILPGVDKDETTKMKEGTFKFGTENPPIDRSSNPHGDQRPPVNAKISTKEPSSFDSESIDLKKEFLNGIPSYVSVNHQYHDHANTGIHNESHGKVIYTTNALDLTENCNNFVNFNSNISKVNSVNVMTVGSKYETQKKTHDTGIEEKLLVASHWTEPDINSNSSVCQTGYPTAFNKIISDYNSCNLNSSISNTFVSQNEIMNSFAKHVQATPPEPNSNRPHLTDKNFPAPVDSGGDMERKNNYISTNNSCSEPVFSFSGYNVAKQNTSQNKQLETIDQREGQTGEYKEVKRPNNEKQDGLSKIEMVSNVVKAGIPDSSDSSDEDDDILIRARNSMAEVSFSTQNTEELASQKSVMKRVANIPSDHSSKGSKGENQYDMVSLKSTPQKSQSGSNIPQRVHSIVRRFDRTKDSSTGKGENYTKQVTSTFIPHPPKVPKDNVTYPQKQGSRKFDNTAWSGNNGSGYPGNTDNNFALRVYPARFSPHRAQKTTQTAVIPQHQVDANHRNRAFTKTKDNALFIPLDKTPTDDDINVLWENVRNCLHANDQEVAFSDSAFIKTSPRKHYKAFELPDNFRGNRQRIGERSTVKYELPQRDSTKRDRAFLPFRRYGSHENLRRQNSLDNLVKNREPTGSHRLMQRARSGKQTLNQNDNYRGEMNDPRYSSKTPVSSMKRAEVSDSLMSFVEAETYFNNESLSPEQAKAAFKASDSLHKTIAQNQHHIPSRRYEPSALSIEERKAIESLERLNLRLRDQEALTNELICNAQKNSVLTFCDQAAAQYQIPPHHTPIIMDARKGRQHATSATIHRPTNHQRHTRKTWSAR